MGFKKKIKGATACVVGSREKTHESRNTALSQAKKGYGAGRLLVDGSPNAQRALGETSRVVACLSAGFVNMFRQLGDSFHP